MLWRSLSKRLPADVAEDLTQQVILKIFVKLEDFVPWHDNDAFERWIMVISSRMITEHARATQSDRSGPV